MLAIDTETTGLFIHKGCRPFTISAACSDHKSYLWNFQVNPTTREVIYHTPKAKALLKDFKQTVAKHRSIIFHNANFDIQALDAIGLSKDYLFDNHEVHDTMVMSHAYKSDNPHSLKQLAMMILEFPEDDEKRLSDITKKARDRAASLGWCTANKNRPHPTLRGTQKEWHKTDYWIPAQLAATLNLPPNHEWHTICNEYAEKDAIRTLALYIVFQELMTAKQRKAYNKARKLIRPILNMEYERVQLIPSELSKAKKEYSTKLDHHTNALKKLCGNKDFNPDSPKDLKHVLFNHYKFKPYKEGKNGPSTDKNVIIHLLKDCPIEGTIPPRYQFLLELKKQRKAKTTNQYITNYYIHKDENYRLQGFYKQTSTGTNRLSCENPNLTNVGKKDSNNPFGGEPGVEHLAHLLGENDSFKLRNVFGPSEGETWTCIDYKQFQLLIFAVVSDSKPLLKAFEEGADVHNAVAVELFKTDNISSVQRTAAKAINFGLLFGAGPAKIELLAGMPGLYNQFLSAFPKARQYLDTQSRLVKTKGYVHTVGGYRLYVPRDRAYAASCYVIQGSEAEIVRSAMVDIDNYIRATKNCPYRMIMMVHDELVFRSRRRSDTHLRNIMNLMENAGNKLGIPAKVDAELVTTSWADKEPLVLE